MAGKAYSVGDVYNLCALPHDRAVRRRWPQHLDAAGDAGGALADIIKPSGAAVAAGATGAGAAAGEAAVDDDTWAKQARPYQIPHTPLSEKWADVKRNKHMAFMYVFVHVVKTGGTSFEHHLMVGPGRC